MSFLNENDSDFIKYDEDVEEIDMGSEDDDLLDNLDGEDLEDGIGEEIEDSFEEDSLYPNGDEADGILYDRPSEEDGEGQKKVIQGACNNLMRCKMEAYCAEGANNKYAQMQADKAKEAMAKDDKLTKQNPEAVYGKHPSKTVGQAEHEKNLANYSKASSNVDKYSSKQGNYKGLDPKTTNATTMDGNKNPKSVSNQSYQTFQNSNKQAKEQFKKDFGSASSGTKHPNLDQKKPGQNIKHEWAGML